MGINGCCTALITPFKKDKSVDFELFKKQIKRQLDNKVSGLLACGTTGESPALSDDEWEKVVKVANSNKKNSYLIAGTGTNNTEKTIEKTKIAESIGVDYALVITPYYNKPNQQGLVEHFKKVAKSTKLEIIIYNVPSRTGVNILPETVAHLSEIKNIVGIKEASGNLNQTTEILLKAKKGFSVMSGEDSIFLPILSVGGVGIISTISNVVPEYMQSLFELFFAKEIEECRKLHHFLYPISKVLFVETNPVPVKYCMEYLNLDSGELRLPLAPLSENNKKLVEETVKNMGLKKEII
uniref:4-hydroxy-tetrahydrodipicolinate synthase n=1 Tax=candidate division WOR-3 bacterium TaxID=2052148 RepID=A0A7C3N6I7_UNCW3